MPDYNPDQEGYEFQAFGWRHNPIAYAGSAHGKETRALLDKFAAEFAEQSRKYWEARRKCAEKRIALAKKMRDKLAKVNAP